MKTIISLIFLAAFTGNSFAGTGIIKTDYHDKTRKRTISIHVFYPTTEKNNQKTAENPVFYGIDTASNAKISAGKYPLIFLAHGTSGNWRNSTWIAKALASKAIVVSANFPDYTSGQATPEKVINPSNYVKDISFLTNEILKDKRFVKHIKKEQIAVIGHSLGGYAALALAGAKIDLRKYQEFCKTHKDKACNYFAKALKNLPQSVIYENQKSLLDKRIAVSIALAPGLTESMTQDSLKQLKTPALIISAEKDENIPPKTHLANIPDNIAQYQIKEAGHFSFLQECKEKALLILAEEDAEFVCQDANKSRKAIHKEAIEKIKQFLATNHINI